MLDVIFYIAIAAEAMTAALAAGRRKMDWFGVCLLACVTALGGGTTRDLFLGHYPLYWVGNPYILLLVCGAALFTIAIARVVDKLRWPSCCWMGWGWWSSPSSAATWPWKSGRIP